MILIFSIFVLIGWSLFCIGFKQEFIYLMILAMRFLILKNSRKYKPKKPRKSMRYIINYLEDTQRKIKITGNIVFSELSSSCLNC